MSEDDVSSKRKKTEAPTDLLIPYAFDEAGKVWAPRMLETASPEARSLRFVCPCGAPVTLRAGHLRRWHFAHTPLEDEERCTFFDKLYGLKYAHGGGRESFAHIRAKHLFDEQSFRERVRLLKLCAAPVARDAHVVSSQTIDATWQYRSEYFLKAAAYRCDVAFLDSAGSLKLVVEVARTHRVRGEKREWLRGQVDFDYVEVAADNVVEQHENGQGGGSVEVIVLDSTAGPQLCEACARDEVSLVPRGKWSLFHSPRDGPPVLWGDGETLYVEPYGVVSSFMLHFLVPLPADQRADCFVCDGRFLYRVDPAKVRGHRIDVSDRIARAAFFEVATPMVLFDSPPPPNSLRIVQKGAGSGKTYDSIQLLCGDLYFSKKTFIYLTKVHTAKEVIRNEFWDQLHRGALSKRLAGSEWELTEEDWVNGVKVYCDKQDVCNGARITQTETGGSSPKYEIRYENPSAPTLNLQIFIGTIDSFVWALDRCVDKSDPVALQQSAPGDVHAQKVREVANSQRFASTALRYAACLVELDDKCLVNVDEVQDLSLDYVEMFVKIIRGTRVDISVVGDKLQSLWHEDNIFTSLCDGGDGGVPNVVVNREPPENVVKRFHNPAHLEAVNRAVPFAKYGLPEVHGICDRPGECDFSHAPVDFKLFALSSSDDESGDDDHPKRIALLLPKLREFIESELAQNPEYTPANFCIVTPFVGSQSAKNEWTVISNFLEDVWSEEMAGRNDVRQPYVFWHKSEDGARPINLRDSEGCMRILSIHASKGTGCDVIFLLNCSEAALKYGDAGVCGAGTRSLTYDSKINVALTRQKRMLYVEISDVQDDFTRRFDTGHLKLEPGLQQLMGGSSLDAVALTRALWSGDAATCRKTCEDLGLGDAEEAVLLSGQEHAVASSAPPTIVDWGDHTLRGSLLFWHTLLGVLKIEADDSKALKAALDTFFSRSTVLLEPKAWNTQFYKTRALYKKKDFQNADLQPIPVLRLSGTHKYGEYGHRMLKRLEDMKERYREAGKGVSVVESLCRALAYGQTCTSDHILNVLAFHTHFEYANGRVDDAPPIDLYRVVESFNNQADFDKLRQHYERLSRVQKLCGDLRGRFGLGALRWQLNDIPVLGGVDAGSCGPFKFWASLVFHGFELLDEGKRVRSLIISLQPSLDECNARRTLVKQAFAHYMTTGRPQHPKAKNKCERWETATALLALNCVVKLFGHFENGPEVLDVRWDVSEHVSELTAALELCTSLHFAPKHAQLYEVLLHYVDKHGKKAVSKLRNKIVKMQGSKRLYGSLANHIDHFLTIFESKHGEGDNLLDARDRFLSLLDERLRKNVSSSGGMNAHREDSDSDD